MNIVIYVFILLVTYLPTNEESRRTGWTSIFPACFVLWFYFRVTLSIYFGLYIVHQWDETYENTTWFPHVCVCGVCVCRSSVATV